MKNKILIFLILVLVLVLLSCDTTRENDKEFTLIKTFRVLSIVAEPPETKPNRLVTLSGLAVDPQSRELSYGWFISTDPRDKNFDPSKVTPLGTGDKITFSPSLPPEIYNIFLVVVAQKDFPADPHLIEHLPHTLARKEIIISENDLPRENPVIKKISLDPNPFSITSGTSLKINVEMENPNEVYSFTWLSREEGLQKDFGNPVDWIAPANFTKTSIYLIVRDNMNGQAFSKIDLPETNN